MGMVSNARFHDNLVGIAPLSLHSLRRSLERRLGDEAPAVIQEVGHAAGEQVFAAFKSWLSDRSDVSAPADLDSKLLGEALSDFVEWLGWGTLKLERAWPAALAVDTKDWAEAEPGADTDYPACSYTTGLLASILGLLADDTVAVMEVECRSRGDSRCRFLIGAPATLQTVYQSMVEGKEYSETLSA